MALPPADSPTSVAGPEDVVIDPLDLLPQSETDDGDLVPTPKVTPLTPTVKPEVIEAPTIVATPPPTPTIPELNPITPAPPLSNAQPLQVEELDKEDRGVEGEEKEEEDSVHTDGQIKKIIAKSRLTGESKYYVEWNNGERAWVYEEDLDCPALLVKFTTDSTKDLMDRPHELLAVLIEALIKWLETAVRNPAMSLVTMKRRLKEHIGRGNPYLHSSRVVYALETQLAGAMTHSDICDLVRYWVSCPNEAFAGEWDHPG